MGCVGEVCVEMCVCVCVKVAGCVCVCMCVGRGEEGGCKKSERTYITRQRQSGGEKWGADIVNLGSLFP